MNELRGAPGAAEDTARAGPARVLIVGDPATAGELRRELARGGYEAHCERVDRPEALSSALEQDGWAIVLCDDGLSDLDAPSALRQVKGRRPELPVIVVSSTFGEGIAAAAMKAGADDFLARGYLARLVPAVERETRAARTRRRWKRTAQTLREAEAWHHAFMDNNPAVAFLKDEQGRFVYVNRTLERIFQVSFEHLRGKTDAEWFSPEVAAQNRATDETVRASGRPMEFEEHVPTPDGPRDWLVFKFPLDDGSGKRFVGGVAVDITARKRAEEALRVSEDLYRGLVEHGHVLICAHDLEGRILAVNEAVEKSLGYGDDVHLGRDIRNIRDILAPSGVKSFTAYLETIRSKGSASGIMAVRTRGGDTRYWDYRNTLQAEGVASPVVRGVAIDVTERIRAENALREARQFSEEIIASAGQGIIVYGPDLRYLLWNRFMEELTGLPRADVIGKSPIDLFPHVREQGIWELLHRALAGEVVASHDTRYSVPATGRTGWVSSTFAPHRNVQGEIVGVIGIVKDIGARKQAEEALRDNQSFLERAQEVAQIGSWISGLRDSDALLWSRETCRIFGIASEAFDGKVQTFFEMVHPEDRESVRRASEAALSSGVPYTIDHRIVRPDGSVRWVHEQADVVRDPAGRAVKMVGIVQDITDKRRLEDQFLQSQKMEAIGRLAGGVAHDFNNLLTAILGYTDLLLTRLPPADAIREDLEQIQSAGERAASLTRQLLAFSRQQMLEPKVIDLNATIENLEKMLRRLIGEDVALVADLDPNLGFVRADPVQIEQVILNLTVNSRDAMPDGGTLAIQTRRLRLESALSLGRTEIDPGEYVVLSVSDTGTGMDAATQQRLFEPFFTTKEKGKGTGLGLATAYGIVKQSGGYIACESALGRGTTFRIYLSPQPVELAAPPRPRERVQPGPRATETVLLVEDEDGVRRLSRKLLEGEGYQVLEASSGMEAIRLATEHSGAIDLLLTDVVMPGMKGPEVAEKLTELRPRLKVLYMSGYTDRGEMRLAGEVPLLQKPFSPASLSARIREALAGDADARPRW